MVRPGYKRTEVGEIPEDWDVAPLAALSHRIMVGIASAATHAYRAKGVVMFRNQNIKPGRLDDSDVLHIDEAYELPFRDKRLQPGDLLTARTGYPGTTCVVPPEYSGAQSFTTLITRPNSSIARSNYLCFFINSPAGQLFVAQSKIGGGQQNINVASLRLLPVAIPPTEEEQSRIAIALEDADALVDSLEQLLAKKRAIKQGAMQSLLTGSERLPGFTGQWSTHRIGEIASPSTDLNVFGEALPVLTCSKHSGFVDSLSYFKNQVFSRDLSGYKLIKRGQIGYPSNHVEEGSIGIQDRYDVAVVSPIYVVITVAATLLPFFLHRLLKLDAYRHQFATLTNASVDRRGSLRWPAFSQLRVTLPSLPEQAAIAEVLTDLDADLDATTAKLAKARAIKMGMMQELLTGRIRLV